MNTKTDLKIYSETSIDISYEHIIFQTFEKEKVLFIEEQPNLYMFVCLLFDISTQYMQCIHAQNTELQVKMHILLGNPKDVQ